MLKIPSIVLWKEDAYNCNLIVEDVVQNGKYQVKADNNNR